MELLVTVSGTDWPTALEVRLFEGALPGHGSYESNSFSAVGNAGLWSIAISSHDLKETTYYVAVKGTDVGEVEN